MRRIAFLALFLSAQTAFAVTPETRHLDPTCGTNGNGTLSTCTAGGAGTAGAYNHMDNALSDINSDYASFVASDKLITLQVHPGVDVTGQATFSATTDATRYLIITAVGADRSNGTYSGYRLQCGFGDFCLKMDSLKWVIDGWALKQTVPDGSGKGAGIWDADKADANESGEVSNMFFWYVQSSGSANTNSRNAAIDCQFCSGSLKVRNSIFYNWMNAFQVENFFATSPNYQFHNNTIVDSRGRGMNIDVQKASGDTLRLKNNLVKGSATADITITSSASTQATANNNTSDTSSPDGGSYQSRTFTFVNAGSQDFHLSASDTGALNRGTDLSADANYPFSDDIDGSTRTGTWDAGADEVASTTNYLAVLQAMGEL